MKAWVTRCYRLTRPRATRSARRFKVSRITEPTLFSRLAVATSPKHTLSQLASQAITMIEAQVLPLYANRCQQFEGRV